MKEVKDPFRIFFPLGAVLGAVGVGPWVLHIFQSAGYPLEFHRSLMMNGFMLSFVCGFLMTAIPRFTATGFARVSEVFTAMVLILLAGFFAAVDRVGWHYLAAAGALITLIFFAVRRFKHRKANPPFTFVFLGIGLILWTLANFMLFLAYEGILEISTMIWRDLVSSGALMAIVLGVGGRLIPGIMGWQEIVHHQRNIYEPAESFIVAVPRAIWLAVGIYLISFVLPLIPVNPWVTHFLRALVIGFFALQYWKLHKFPKTRSYLTWGIWLSCWSLLFGSILNIFWATPHSLHAILVGGFSLLTLLVATRVTLAHGGSGLDLEKTSRLIPVFTFFIILAMLTRVTAILWPAIYFKHLGYASVCWILGLVFWLMLTGPKFPRIEFSRNLS